jgi:hypothetical protein
MYCSVKYCFSSKAALCATLHRVCSYMHLHTTPSTAFSIKLCDVNSTSQDPRGRLQRILAAAFGSATVAAGRGSSSNSSNNSSADSSSSSSDVADCCRVPSPPTSSAAMLVQVSASVPSFQCVYVHIQQCCSEACHAPSSYARWT